MTENLLTVRSETQLYTQQYYVINAVRRSSKQKLNSTSPKSSRRCKGMHWFKIVLMHDIRARNVEENVI